MKDVILCTVADLFLKYGVRSISMDDIAHHQGISKKTIYENFKDKNDLVVQVTLKFIEKWVKEYEEIKINSIDAIDELFLLTKLIRKHFAKLNPSLMFDVRKYHPQAWDMFLKYEEDIAYPSVVDNLKRGIEEGFFRPDINVQILAKIRLEQIHHTIDEDLFPKDQFDLMEVRLQIFDHFVHGLLSKSGLFLFNNYQKRNDE